MTRGLFVTRWHGGTQSQEAADEMLAFCDKTGVTDIYLGCHEDQSTFDKQFDYKTYILANKGTKKVLAWVSTTVGRERENNWTKNRMEALGLKTVRVPIENGIKLKLDLTDQNTNAFFNNLLLNFIVNYPFDGKYVDGGVIDGKIIYCFPYPQEKVNELIKAVEDNGQKPILYCYGKLSANTKF